MSRSIGELFGALRGRLLDSNKNLVMQTLTTIGGVASAMGPAVEKASKVGDTCQAFKTILHCNKSLPASFTKYLSDLLQGILSDVLKCLGDNKKHMRECTLAALDLWLGAVHLDKMVGCNVFRHAFSSC